MQSNEDKYHTGLYTPKEFVDMFESDDELRSLFETKNCDELLDFLMVFEYNELYEQCAIIRDIMLDKYKEYEKH